MNQIEQLEFLQARSRQLKEDLPRVTSRFSRQAIRRSIANLQGRIDLLINSQETTGGDAA